MHYIMNNLEFCMHTDGMFLLKAYLDASRASSVICLLFYYISLTSLIFIPNLCTEFAFAE